MNYKLKQIRLDKEMTQRDLYQHLCSRRQYSRIENNHSHPSVFLLYQFAKLLNVKLDDLIVDDNS